MNVQRDAIRAVATAMGEMDIAYMLVGGIANAVWGEPRATLDVDVTVWVEPEDVPNAVSMLTQRFSARTGDPAAFVDRTRVLPLTSIEGVQIDVIFGLLPFEEQAIRRARDVDVAGVRAKVCTAEDLVLMKIISERERDVSDARGVVHHRGDELDRAYLEPRIRELASLLDRPEILQRWNDWCAEADQR